MKLILLLATFVFSQQPPLPQDNGVDVPDGEPSDVNVQTPSDNPTPPTDTPSNSPPTPNGPPNRLPPKRPNGMGPPRRPTQNTIVSTGNGDQVSVRTPENNPNVTPEQRRNRMALANGHGPPGDAPKTNILENGVVHVNRSRNGTNSTSVNNTLSNSNSTKKIASSASTLPFLSLLVIFVLQ
eukprot:NODE_366_length_8705_cov_0.466070.p7 type:complete len:182 gc:universal NODE_366_length_8705_cov_0.466070:2882-3427(+)